jgi:hypothetical protein
LKVDVDEAPEIAQAYSVECMPTFLFLKKEKVLAKMEGANAK